MIHWAWLILASILSGSLSMILTALIAASKREDDK